ncbi:hypothetical protein JCM16303_001779, partial [Sporobolomyces ruberrimus]
MASLPGLPAIPLPALPSLSSPGPSSSSVTPQPPPTNKRPTPNTPDTATDGPPKRKRVRKSVASTVASVNGGTTPGETTPGPGKSWRRGLKGNLAGVGLEGAMAAAARETSTKPSTPIATSTRPVATSPAPPPVPLPPLIPFHPPPRTASHLVGAPPKLATQFLPPQVLEPGAPRPRRWARARMEFRNVMGGTISLTSWQGDTYSSYAEHLNRNQIDELASPPPPPTSTSTPSTRLPPVPSQPTVQTSSGPKPSLSRPPQTQPPIEKFSPYPIPSPQPPPQPNSSTQNLAPPTIPPFHDSSSQSPGSNPAVSPLAPPTYPPLPLPTNPDQSGGSTEAT